MIRTNPASCCHTSIFFLYLVEVVFSVSEENMKLSLCKLAPNGAHKAPNQFIFGLYLGAASKPKTGQTSESVRTGGRGVGLEGSDVRTCLADLFLIASLRFACFETLKY